MSGPGPTRIRFADCELDLATRELRRDGEPVALQPRVFDLLAFLVETRERAVDKNAIQDAVWSGMVVTEAALTRAIMKARRAVGDDADRQAVIRTVHGHGYQFVAAVEDGLDAPKAEPDGRSGRPARLLRPLALAATVAVVAALLAVWLLPGGVPDRVRIAVMPVVNSTGDAEFAWATYGVMGLANELLRADAAVDVVPASSVVRYAEDAGWTGPADHDTATLGRAFGATHVLVSEIEEHAGALRLSYVLIGPDGYRSENTMVASEPAALARGMARGVDNLLGTRRRAALETNDRAADPFINEAYARGLSFALEGRCNEALPLLEIVRGRADRIGNADLEWAECARIAGLNDAAEAAYLAVAGYGDAEPKMIARAYNGLGSLYNDVGRLDDADRMLRAGLDIATEHGDRENQGRLYNNLSILARDRGDLAAARDYVARAILAYRELGVELLPGQLHSALANIAMSEGRLGDAEEHLDDALVSFRELGDRRNEAMMLNNYGYLRRLEGRFAEAEPLHLESLAIRRDIGDRVGQGRILGMLSTLYTRKGRHADARDAAAEAVGIAREANDSLFLATGLAQLASAERGLGNTAAAKEALLASRSAFLDIEDASRALQVDLRLAELMIDDGEFAAASTLIRDVKAKALSAGFHEPAIEAMDYSGDLALKQNRAAEAELHYEEAIGKMDASGFTARRTDVVTKLATLRLDRGDTAAVEPLLGYLVEQAAGARTLKLEARYAFAMGDSERAVELMENAKAEAGTAWSVEDERTLAGFRTTE